MSTPDTLRLHSVPLSALSWTPKKRKRAAEVVVLLHGFPDVPHSWAPVAERLSGAGYHVVAPYLPGYAPSSRDLPLDMGGVASVLARAIDELSPERPGLLVGHDWGAVVSYPLMQQAGPRIRRACTMAVPHFAAFGENFSLRQLRRSWYILFFQLGPIADHFVRANDFALIRKLWRDWSPDYTAPEAEMRVLLDCLDRSMPHPVDWYRSQTALTGDAGARRAAVTDRIPEPIETPVLYMHGRNDGCIGAEMLKGQARFFAGEFRERVLDDCGHFLQVERPGVVADELLAWFGEG